MTENTLRRRQLMEKVIDKIEETGGLSSDSKSSHGWGKRGITVLNSSPEE